MSRHELPSGGWFELRSPEQITERQRRMVRSTTARLSSNATRYFEEGDSSDPAAAAAALTPADIDLLFNVNDIVAAETITAASFLAEGAKCSVDDVLDLIGADYDAVLAASAKLLPAFVGVDFDPNTDPARATPTTASGA